MGAGCCTGSAASRWVRPHACGSTRSSWSPVIAPSAARIGWHPAVRFRSDRGRSRERRCERRACQTPGLDELHALRLRPGSRPPRQGEAEALALPVHQTRYSSGAQLWNWLAGTAVLVHAASVGLGQTHPAEPFRPTRRPCGSPGQRLYCRPTDLDTLARADTQRESSATPATRVAAYPWLRWTYER